MLKVDVARATLRMCCALFIGENRERLIFYEFFFEVSTHDANGSERVKHEYRIVSIFEVLYF